MGVASSHPRLNVAGRHRLGLPERGRGLGRLVHSQEHVAEQDQEPRVPRLEHDGALERLLRLGHAPDGPRHLRELLEQGRVVGVDHQARVANVVRAQRVVREPRRRGPELGPDLVEHGGMRVGHEQRPESRTTAEVSSR